MNLHGTVFYFSLWKSMKSEETFPEFLNIFLLILHGLEVLNLPDIGIVLVRVL